MLSTDIRQYEVKKMQEIDYFAPAPASLDEWRKDYPNVRGTIYHDKSSKGLNLYGKPSRHNAYRAEVSYQGKKYRKRSILYMDCVQFLVRLHQENTNEPELF